MIYGSTCAGKTNFIKKFIYGNFSHNEPPTLGLPNYFYEFKISKIKKNIHINFIDTNGQEIFSSINASFFKIIDIFILLFKAFETFNRNAFNDLDRLIKMIRKKKRGKYYNIVLIANRFDETNKREIYLDEIIKKCEDNNLIWAGEYNLETCSKEELEDMMINIFVKLKIIEDQYLEILEKS